MKNKYYLLKVNQVGIFSDIADICNIILMMLRDHFSVNWSAAFLLSHKMDIFFQLAFTFTRICRHVVFKSCIYFGNNKLIFNTDSVFDKSFVVLIIKQYIRATLYWKLSKTKISSLNLLQFFYLYSKHVCTNKERQLVAMKFLLRFTIIYNIGLHIWRISALLSIKKSAGCFSTIKAYLLGHL